MNQIANLIEDLSQLAELDATRRRLHAKSPTFKEIALQIERVRERLPTAILKHYDLRLSKGKRGAAKVHNNTCGGCHLSLPVGQLADMRRNDVALQVCGYCSVFLLPEDSKAAEAEPAAAAPPVPKPASSPRKRRTNAQV